MTTNPLVDDIEQLASCQSNAERAAWLLSARIPVLLKYEITIRNRLRLAAFDDGVAYLEEELWRCRQPRVGGEITQDSLWRPTMLRLVANA